MLGVNLKTWKFSAAVSLLAVFACSPAFAQFDTGAIVGTVFDPHGAVIVGASIKVTDVGTGRVYTVATDSSGGYDVPSLPVGIYEVQASHAGFATGIVSHIVLHANVTFRADVTLQVGAVQQQVTVAAEATSINTTNPDAGTTIAANLVQNIPLNGRDFTDLLALVPGSVTAGEFGQTSLSGFETSFAGVNFLLDGADASRIDTNATANQLGRQEARITRASVDSIAEFKVLQSNYSAEFGRSMGDVVNVITKSGTNNLHGSLFEYFRNDWLDAKNYFQVGTLPLRLNQFGGNLGGPIVQDKLFFFVNYEGVRQVVNSPTEEEVLSQASRALAVSAMQPVINAIPPGNAGPVPGSSGALDFRLGSLRDTLREDTGSVKVDWNAARNDTFSVRYNISDDFTNTQYGLATGQFAPTFGRTQYLKGTWNHTFAPNLLNEFGLAYNRPHTDSLGGGGNFPLIFQCVFCTATNQFGLTPGEDLFSVISPQYSFEVLETLRWVKGKHSLSFGADIRDNHTGRATQPQVFLGYAGITDFLNNNGFTLSTLGFNLVNIRNTNWDFFAQDDFRVTPRFTVNLGLRYEYNTVLHGDRISNFNLTTLTVGPANAPLYEADRNNFAPRIGFAWDPFGKGKTAIRGGFGIFYNPQLTGAALSLAQNDQPSLSVNIFQILFGTVSCTPPLTSIGYPPPSPIPTCTPQTPSVNTLDPRMRDSYAEHWSFGIDQEVFRNSALSVIYVGDHGIKLPAGAASAGLELNIPPFSGAAPRLSPNFFNIRFLGDFLSSEYNALQVNFRSRVVNGLDLTANYTWSHEFDDAVSIFSAFQNSLDPQGDWSPGDIDIRQNFSLGWVYDVPVASWLPKHLAQGWQLSSLFQAHTGFPVNITLSTPFLGLDLIRPNLVPGQSIRPANFCVPGILGVCGQLNPNAFQPPPDNQYGDLPRNAARGPGFAQLDLSLAKTTNITERLGVQFRVDTFNLFNHPNFQNPVSALSSGLFGQSVSTVGNLVGVGTSRQIQLALRLLF